ncbi:MAG: phosphoribosylanthranilate isomerase [Lachnospiraceae bacterium]|nr:phosphoribosylanthranilate isomerase [Lachnospiraceae bacterium]
MEKHYQGPKIKICGLTREQDIEAVNEAMPDYIGFVFWRKSKRWLTKEDALRLGKMLSPGIQKVGVFVDEEPEVVAALLEEGVIDLAQLHGREDEDYIQSLRSMTAKKLIKAFTPEALNDPARIEGSLADMILLDSGKGSGKTFDWKILEGIRRPYFLAGGLGFENMETVLSKLQPFGADVSSGVETEGVKDREKILRFVRMCRERG